MSPSRVTTTPLPRPPSSSGLPSFAGAFGLDQDERGQDRLVDERREGRRRRDRGERVGHGVIHVLLRERRPTGDEGAVEEDRQEGDDGARHERRRAAKARRQAIGSRRDVRSSRRRFVSHLRASRANPRPSLHPWPGGVRRCRRRVASGKSTAGSADGPPTGSQPPGLSVHRHAEAGFSSSWRRSSTRYRPSVPTAGESRAGGRSWGWRARKPSIERRPVSTRPRRTRIRRRLDADQTSSDSDQTASATRPGRARPATSEPSDHDQEIADREHAARSHTVDDDAAYDAARGERETVATERRGTRGRRVGDRPRSRRDGHRPRSRGGRPRRAQRRVPRAVA